MTFHRYSNGSTSATRGDLRDHAGRIAEEGPVSEVFRRPRHPYTQKLLAAFPNIKRWFATVRAHLH